MAKLFRFRTLTGVNHVFLQKLDARNRGLDKAPLIWFIAQLNGRRLKIEFGVCLGWFRASVNEITELRRPRCRKSHLYVEIG